MAFRFRFRSVVDGAGYLPGHLATMTPGPARHRFRPRSRGVG